MQNISGRSFGGSKKLMHGFYGPFKVLRCIGEITCELESPPSMQVHDVVNVNLLKPYRHEEGGGNDATTSLIARWVFTG